MPHDRLTPGVDHVHRGAIWQVEKVELRGFSPVEKWAKLVRTEGVGATSRLINVCWIQFDEEKKNDE